MTTLTPDPINCNARHLYQGDFEVPNAKGDLATPSALGQLGGITMRLSLTEDGPAIHANVDNLATTELAAKVGRLQCEVSQALHQTHLLPLGSGAVFHAIWSKTGEFDMEHFPYTVATSHTTFGQPAR